MSEEKQICVMDIDTLTYRVNDQTWDIVDEKKVGVIRPKLLELTREFEIAYKKSELEVDRILVNDKFCKDVLALTLPAFDYEKESNNPEIGAIICNRIAGDLRDLFLVLGGIRGYRHLLQRQSQMQLLMDSPKD